MPVAAVFFLQDTTSGGAPNIDKMDIIIYGGEVVTPTPTPTLCPGCSCSGKDSFVINTDIIDNTLEMVPVNPGSVIIGPHSDMF